MIEGYKEVRGIVRKKYRSLLGKYILVLDENGTKTKIQVGSIIFERAGIGSKWTIGHIHGKMVNVRPGFCKNTDE